MLIEAWLEPAASALALAYLVLAIRERRSCFLVAIASAGLYIVIFWRASLLMESALQWVYIAVSLYGWKQWGSDAGKDRLPVTTKPWRWHLVALASIAVLAGVSGGLLTRYTSAALPFLDATTTIAAVLATWMVARKILENWLYWIAIDLLSIYLYLSRGLDLTAALFAGYVVLAAVGYWQWRKHLANHSV
ncbi:nicotinamide mononucleotide transporter PnuC [Luminiphilus syltensis NOR5-1B]|uniref:Nicotinamide riboside transporter PnuC n=1 Tax=Luminiphilus syltensis NOR5-1B TaxID=565045 RepID=B8KQN4_9GAMM|nr:nicotinamide riboside transporter PnuC [Luminiphilus syltensis]EED36697.1 nicotinamide mononucleotide transporter PnuC [Luminiphilus syltensis NOR5-1B]